MDEVEVWRAAGALMKQFGRSASSIAEEHAGILLERGEDSRSFDWLRIFRAVEDLSREKRRPDERLN